MKTKNKTVEYEVHIFSIIRQQWDYAARLATLKRAREAINDWKKEWPGDRLRIVKVTKEVVK